MIPAHGKHARVHAGSLLIAGLALASCGPGAAATYGPRRVDIPVADTMAGRARAGDDSGRERPPPPLDLRDAPASSSAAGPAATESRLGNGMSVDVIAARALPLVHVRLLVRAPGPLPGVAALTGEVLAASGPRAVAPADVARRVEALGLAARTGQGGTVFSLDVPRELLGEALAFLAQVVREPRLDADDLKRVRARTASAAAAAAASDPAWALRRLVLRELEGPGSALATSSELSRIELGAVRELHRRGYVPRATTLVLAGDVEPETGKALAERHFGGWSGGDPLPAPSRAETAPPRPRVFVVHRPRAADASIFVVARAAGADPASVAASRVALGVLAAGPTSRLSGDVREHRAPASSVSLVALDPVPAPSGDAATVVAATAPADRAAATVGWIVDGLERMIHAPPSAAETEAARRYVADALAMEAATPGWLADRRIRGAPRGPSRGADVLREVSQVDAAHATAAAKRLFAHGRAFVVAVADEARVAPSLARWGEVVVVDPESDLSTVRTLAEVNR